MQDSFLIFYDPAFPFYQTVFTIYNCDLKNNILKFKHENKEIKPIRKISYINSVLILTFQNKENYDPAFPFYQSEKEIDNLIELNINVSDNLKLNYSGIARVSEKVRCDDATIFIGEFNTSLATKIEIIRNPYYSDIATVYPETTFNNFELHLKDFV